MGSSLLQLAVSDNKLANPFAPFPLQELHHYYGLVRHPWQLRCSASWTLSTCAFRFASVKDFPCSI